MNTGDLRNRIDVYAKAELENELGEKDPTFVKVKTIFAQILPNALDVDITNWQSENQDIEPSYTIKYRRLSLRPTMDMYFVYDGVSYDVLYFWPDFESTEYWNLVAKVRL